MLEKAGKKEIDEILMAAMKRKRELYPEYDLVYMAVPKNDLKERKQTIAWIFDSFEKEGGAAKTILEEVVREYLSRADEKTIDEMIQTSIKRKRELYSGKVFYDVYSKEFLEKEQLRYMQMEKEYKEYLKREFGR